MQTKEHKLSDLSWQEQLKALIKAYHRGIVTYREYVLKRADIFAEAQKSGVSVEELDAFEA